MKMHYLQFSLLFIVILISSCSIVPSDDDFKSESLLVKFPFDKFSNWKEITPESSDFAIQNSKSKSIIVLNSLCRRYENTTLEVLANNSTKGLKIHKLLDDNKLQFKNREAYSKEVKGSLDGVKVYIKLFLFKKDRCVYDVFLTTVDEVSFKNDKTAMKTLINSISFEK